MAKKGFKPLNLITATAPDRVLPTILETKILAELTAGEGGHDNVLTKPPKKT